MTNQERDDLMQALKQAKEINSDQYDASYKLMSKTIEAYQNMGDLSSCDYHDLDVIYHMSIETLKANSTISNKKDLLKKSHLPFSEQEKLKTLLNDCYDKADKNGYINHQGNRKGGIAHIGLFGTGKNSFNGTDSASVIDFIQMCTDILNENDDTVIFDRCQETLQNNIYGVRVGIVSMILHCLKPETFPVLNGNMSSGNIFSEMMGNKLNNLGDSREYIRNCQEIKKFRDEHFKIKHYRYFDVAAWGLTRVNGLTPAEEVRKLSTQLQNKQMTKQVKI